MKTQRLAAIDIGSNSIKLAVAEAAASDSFTIIGREKELLRLGNETLQRHILSEEAISQSIQAITRFRDIAKTRGAERVIVVATAAVREAENSREFTLAVRKSTGLRVDVLSAIEEARLIGIAAAQHFQTSAGSLLNIDIGGGSTELSLMQDGQPRKLFSMKLGSVGLTERFLGHDPPTPKEIKKLRAEIRAALERPVRELKGEKWEISSGTSGTVLALYACLNFQADPAAKTRPDISLKRLAGFNQLTARLTNAERGKLPTISPQRAEILVAGGQILEGVMEALRIKSVTPCEFSLREGVLIDYLREIETESLPPVPDVADPNLRGVFAVGRRFGYEENHALQVAALAEKIFDSLTSIYSFKRHQRTLLAAAALLHDIGYHIAHEAHHKHSYYLIKNSEMTGFSEAEKTIIANIARYHRSSAPKEKHAEFMALTEKEQSVVWKLGAILRLADALDRGYESRVREIKFAQKNGSLTLKLVSDENCESEYEAIEKKKDMFEQAFGCELVLK
ncbi:MAG TPA: Ppx/GppA phosphatase family protein [Pyrinomonadaceae bacterium]|jgi:exopolyphosphatase/guanosine-5'-triphosphate,3'-diphosphate pyrophosphatase|nr:Ppx/GppA phosphatase family protein [Pyrinomonadaceae bacterium]